MKLALLMLAGIAAVGLIVLFISFLLREFGRDSLRIRRAPRARVISQTIAVEYRGKDSPAWERRLCAPQVRGLSLKLRSIGE